MRCELFVGEEAGCESFLKVGDAGEGGYVWEVEVGEAHCDCCGIFAEGEGVEL